MRRVLIGVIASTMLLAVGQARGDSIAFLNEAIYVSTERSEALYGSLDDVTSDEIDRFASPPDSSLEWDSWNNALDAARILVIPSLIVDLQSKLEGGTIDLVRSFVQNGGGLIAGGSNTIDGLIGNPTTHFLNTVFGFDLDFEENATMHSTALATSIAPFAGGPSALPNYPLTSLVKVDSLPSDALNVYCDFGSNGSPMRSSVFGAEYGSGRIAFLGFGWNTNVPEEIAGWNQVLGSAVEYVRPEEVNVVPEPMTLALWQLGAAGVVLAIRRRRRK